MSKKTIIFYHPSSELYGADKILIYVMKNFENYIKILILKFDGPFIDLVKLEVPDVEIRIIPSLPIIAKSNMTIKGIYHFFSSLISFSSKIKETINFQPDIVYLNTLAVVPILFFYASSRIKKFVHIHEILTNSNILNRLINRTALKRSDVIICVSKAVKKNMEIALPEKRDKLFLIYNGINFKRGLSIGNTAFQVDSTKLNFALIGRIKPNHKGQLMLLDAISQLNVKYLNRIHFYFIGSTVPGQEYMLSKVKNRILSLGLTSYVDILPFVREIEQIYQKIDVVIVPSVFEDPFPTTVLEGMFFSKPVIGTCVGGIPEMIDDKVTGFLVEKDNITDLSDKILFFIEHPEKIEEMGNNGKVRFSQNFSEESFYKRYCDMLEFVF